MSFPKPMYQTPILNDVHRKLSEIAIEARSKAAAEDGRIRVEHAARGLAFSGVLISEIAKRLDELHKTVVDECVRLVHTFVERGLSPKNLSMAVQSTLGRFGDEFVMRIPFLGNEALNPATEQVRSKYRAVFTARLDSAIRDIEIGYAGGQNMVMPVKDADRRAVILRRLYDERHLRSWIGFPLDASASQEEQIIAANICGQLAQAGLIIWKPAATGQPVGMAQITAAGIDVIEGTAPAPITIDQRVIITGSTHVQVGNGNVQDLHMTTDKVIAAINNSIVNEAEKKEAKSLWQKVLDNPLLSKFVGWASGS